MTAPVTTTDATPTIYESLAGQMPTLDVNQAFADERAVQLGRIEKAAGDLADKQARFDQRVAEGKMRNLGNGRFMVTEPGTWDNGEIFVVGANGLAMPQHSLDVVEGKTALYSRVPAWHGLGQVVPEGVSDIDTVLDLGGINFEVGLRPVTFTVDAGDNPGILDGKFVTFRGDTKAGLGVVGDRYQVIQNRQVFLFLQELTEHYDLAWETAGGLHGGRRVFVSLRLPEDITIDAEGVNDTVVPFIVGINSHDGNSLFRVVVTPWRPVCGNTERFAVRDAHTYWGIRHSGDPTRALEEARRTLGLSLKYYQNFAAEETKLAQAELAMADFHKLCDEVFPVKPNPKTGVVSKKALTSKDQRQAELDDLFMNAETTANCHGTAYGAERAVTEWLDWKTAVRPGRDRGALNEGIIRATSMLEGAADDKKTQAHQRLIQLVAGGRDKR